MSLGECGIDSTQTYESVMLIMETVSRSVLIFLVEITVPVWMGSIHRQMMKGDVKVYMYIYNTYT